MATNRYSSAIERYSRQEALPEIGKVGQKKLKKAKILIVGLGALGTAQAMYLARAGIGELILVDRDIVELNNLQRQWLFEERDVDSPKAIAAKNHILKINREVKVSSEVIDINNFNAEKIISRADLVLDGTDNMETRYLINDVCVKLKKIWIYGGAVGTTGMTFPIIPGGACFRCLFPQPPSPGDLPTCDTAGILNTIPPVIAAFQVTEALKAIVGEKIQPKLLMIDIWKREINEATVKRNMACTTCKKGNYEFLATRNKSAFLKLCGRNAIQIVPSRPIEIRYEDLAKRLSRVGKAEIKSGILFFRTDNIELIVFNDGRTIIKGTEDPMRAKALFSRYIGD